MPFPIFVKHSVFDWLLVFDLVLVVDNVSHWFWEFDCWIGSSEMPSLTEIIQATKLQLPSEITFLSGVAFSSMWTLSVAWV